MDLHLLTLARAHKGLKNKEFSSRELTQACFDQIDKTNPDFNMFVTLSKDEAFAQADEVDKKIAGGEEISTIAGIPFSIKDILNVKGIRTTCSSKFLENYISPFDASVVKRLKESGVVIVGKNNCDEFACGSSTEYSAYGNTKNPVNPEYVPGGSSGGSSASVAADTCFASIATDTGGSIRLPASFCGVVGLKPTYGRVSRAGVNAMASSWDTVGPLTKTVEDAAIVLNHIAGPDYYDTTMPEKEVPDYTSFLNGDIKGLRIGVPKEFMGEALDPEVRSLVENALEVYKKMGAEVKEISLPSVKYAVAVYYVTQVAELSSNLARFDGVRYGVVQDKEAESLIEFYNANRGAGFGEEIQRRIIIGNYVLSAGYMDAYYKKGQKVRTMIINEFNEMFKKVDVICGPVVPFPAFKFGAKMEDPLQMYLADGLAIPANAAGIPGVSVNCGFNSAGLPVGLQVMGPQFEEGRILNAAFAIERELELNSK